MRNRMLLTLLMLVPAYQGISQKIIEVEGIGGAAWPGKYSASTGIPHFKYARLYFGAGFNYQILKHSFLTSGLYYHQTSGDVPLQLKTLSMPFQWSQRYGKKVQVQLGLGMYTAMLVYHYDGSKYRYIQGGDPLLVTEKNTTITTDLGVAGSASVYIPLTKTVAIKAGINKNWGLKKVQANGDTTATTQRTTAMFGA